MYSRPEKLDKRVVLGYMIDKNRDRIGIRGQNVPIFKKMVYFWILLGAFRDHFSNSTKHVLQKSLFRGKFGVQGVTRWSCILHVDNVLILFKKTDINTILACLVGKVYMVLVAVIFLVA